MPIARVQAPDGRIIRLEVPEGATPEQIQAFVDQEAAAGRLNAPAAPKGKSGFLPAVQAGWENLKGDIAGLAGRSGLMAIKDAEEQQARNKAAAEKAFTPTNDTWLDSPWLKFRETLGGSVPYMAAPLAAGAGAAVLGAPGLAAAGAAGAASALQFTGSNLSRQQQTGKNLADTDLGAAAAAAVPQALLDVVGFKMIPGVRQIFAAAGKELTPKAAAEIAKAGLRNTLADYAKAGVKAVGAEGVTEAAQQVLERLQAGLALDDEAAREEYLQNFIGGAVLGGALAGPGRFRERGQERAKQAQIEEAKRIKAEQDAAALAEQQAAQQQARLQDPIEAQKIVDQYQKAQATYDSLKPGKLAKGADEATKFVYKRQEQQAKEFFEQELKPLIPDYLVAKQTVGAQPAAAPAAPQPAEPPAPTAGDTLFPLEPTTLQPPAPPAPTPDELVAQRAELQRQQTALNEHVEMLRERAANAQTPEESLQLAQQFKQAAAARDAAAQQIAAIKVPKPQDLAKQMQAATKAWQKAKEEGDPEAAARAAARIKKLQADGADLMQPGPELPMEPAGGKSESKEEFFPKVATDTLAPKPLQLPFDATKVAVPDRGQGPPRLPYDPGTDIRAMEANRMDTSRTAQGDLFNPPEMRTKVQTGVGAVSTKTHAQLIADLQIARATKNNKAALEAVEGLRDRKARAAAAKEAPETSSTLTDANRMAPEYAGTRMPGNVAKQQAIRDAGYRAYGAFVYALNRANRGLLNKEALDSARKTVIDSLLNDVMATSGRTLSKGEAQTLREQAGQLLTDLQNRFGDTRDVIDVGTKDEPDYKDVQQSDGSYIRDKIDRPQGTANLESRRVGRQTFGSPFAAAQSIREGLDQLRNDAINGTPGVPGLVGVPTPKTTSPEALNKAIEQAKPSALLERLKDNLPAFAADPERRALAAEWLHKEAIGQKNDVGAEVAAELDRLEQGKRSETERTPAVQRGLYQQGRDARDTTAVQTEIEPETKAQLFDTWEEFDKYLAGDALKELRAAGGATLDTMSRLHAQLKDVKDNIAGLTKSLDALKARRAELAKQQTADAAAADKRLAAAEKKLTELINDRVVINMKPLYARLAAAEEKQQQTYRDIAKIEANIRANLVKFASRFPENSAYVKGALDTWQRAGEAHRDAVDAEYAKGTDDSNVFSAGPVVKADARKQEALTDAIRVMMDDLQFMPDSRTVVAFLNRDLQLHLDLAAANERMQEAADAVRGQKQLVEAGPETIRSAAGATPEALKLKQEMSDARETARAVAARDTTLAALSAEMRKVSAALDAATAELDTATAAVRDAAEARTRRVQPAEDLEAKSNQERREKNELLENLADIPGERVEFKDMQAVAEAFADLPTKVKRLETKAADTTLAEPTRAKARRQLADAKWQIEHLSGLLSADPQARETAVAVGAKRIDELKKKIETARVAAAETPLKKSTQQSRAKTLKDLRTQARALQRFMAEFEQKVTRTPVVTRSEARAQRLWRGNESEEGTRLAPSRRGPLLKQAAIAGNIRTGDLDTTDQRKLSPRNPIVQRGKPKAVTAKQATTAARKDTGVEEALRQIDAIDDLITRIEARMEVAPAAAQAKLQATLERAQTAKAGWEQRMELRVQQLRERKKLIVQSEAVGVDAGVADTPKEAENLKKAEAEAKKPRPTPPPAAPLRGKRGIGKSEGEQRLKAELTKKASGKAVFRPGTTGAGMQVTDVQRAVDAVTDGWTNAGEVRVVADTTDLQDTFPGMPEDAPGLYDTKTGVTYLVAANLHSPRDVGLTIAHEVAGHRGLRGLLGNTYAETMQRLYDGNSALRKEADALAATWKAKTGSTMDTRLATEEALAARAERGDPGVLRMLWNKIVAALPARVRAWFGTKVSNDEIAQIIRNARRHVQDGGPPGPKGSQPATDGPAAVFRPAAPTYASSDVFAQPKSFRERLRSATGLLAEMWGVDMRAPVREALAKGDRARGEQAMYYVRKSDARMSQVYAVFEHGALGLRKDARGRHIVEAGASKSVQDVFKAIEAVPGVDAADKMAKAQIYLTAQRVANDHKAANALDLDADAVGKLRQDMAKFQTSPETMRALENVQKVYADLNRGMIKFLVDTGAIKPEDGAAYTAHDSYVPFYRVRGDGIAELVFDETKQMRIGDVRTQPYLRALEGGTAKVLPLNEAVTRNVMLLTDMGMRNLATKEVAYALQELGRKARTGKKPMQITPGDGGADAKVLRFKQKGEEYHVLVDTTGTPAEGIPGEMVARSLEGTHVVLPAFLRAFGYAADILRAGVTRNPVYVARQLFRDPLAASFTGGLERGPVTAVVKSMASFARQSMGRPSPAADALIRKGVVQSGIYTGDPDDLAKMVKGLAGNDSGAIRKLLNMADRAALRSDMVTRAQLYEDTLARTGSEFDAEMAAMEMMNFHKRGLSPTVQYAARLIPFFNAQIQGLNVLYKAATGKAALQDRLAIQQKFFDRAAILAASTLVYAMAMEDDDVYKNARASEKYNNWFVPLSRGPKPEDNVTLKLPIPFEVGLLFKAIPEALVTAMKGEGTEQDFRAVRNLVLNQIPGAGSVLLPQAVKPLIELGTNHNFFTGREIETAGQQQLAAHERYNARTTELAKRLSEMMPDAIALSPLQIEHAVRGYLGSLPLIVAASTNSLFGDAGGEQADRKLSEAPLVGVLFQDRFGGGATDVLYAKIKAADKVKATYDKMLREGRKQDALIYLKDVENIQTIPALKRAEGELQALAKRDRAVRSSETLTPAKKREALDVIEARREAIAQRYLDAVGAVSR